LAAFICAYQDDPEVADAAVKGVGTHLTQSIQRLMDGWQPRETVALTTIFAISSVVG